MGRPMSQATRDKIAASKRGKPRPPHVTEAVRRANTGRKHARVCCVNCRREHGVNARHKCLARTARSDYRSIFVEHNGPAPWPCIRCGSAVHVIGRLAGEGHVHHRDHNKHNDMPANLAIMHNRCHRKQHPQDRGTDGRFHKAGGMP